MSEKKHERDDDGVCWTTQTVKGELAWILCGRSSYEVVKRCAEHSPLAVLKEAVESIDAGENR